MYIETVIVGGGPAGASAGLNLLKAGRDCCIIDKKIFPRAKLCAGCVTEKTKLLLEEMGITDFESVVERKLSKVRILNAGTEVLSIQPKRSFYMVNRARFDHWLLQKYIDAGGKTLLGERVISVDLNEKKIVTDQRTIEYRYLVGADGAKGITTRLLKRPPVTCGFCIQADVENPLPPEENDVIELDLNIGKNGYYWRFPRGDKDIVGFALVHDKKYDYRKMAQELMPGVKNLQGAFLPFGGTVHCVSDSRGVMLLGDAGGFIDHLTGEGTYYSILTGKLLAEAFQQADAAKTCDSETVADVVQQYDALTKPVLKEVNNSWKFAEMFYKTRSIALKKAANHPKLVEFLSDEQIQMQHCDFDLMKLKKKYEESKRSEN